MKAMLLEGPRELRLADVEKPAASGDKALVQITHSAICGTDLKIYTGDIPVVYPRIMGHEMCGEVIDPGGSGTVRAAAGSWSIPSVYCGICFCCHSGRTSICPNGVLLGRDRDGGFAEYMAVPATLSLSSSPIRSITTRPRRSRWPPPACIRSARSTFFPARRWWCMGLGVSGQIHVQMAKARGAATVIGVTRSAWKRQMAEKLGADLTLASGPRPSASFWKPPTDGAPTSSSNPPANSRRWPARSTWHGAADRSSASASSPKRRRAALLRPLLQGADGHQRPRRQERRLSRRPSTWWPREI